MIILDCDHNNSQNNSPHCWIDTGVLTFQLSAINVPSMYLQPVLDMFLSTTKSEAPTYIQYVKPGIELEWAFRAASLESPGNTRQIIGYMKEENHKVTQDCCAMLWVFLGSQDTPYETAECRRMWSRAATLHVAATLYVEIQFRMAWTRLK